MEALFKTTIGIMLYRKRDELQLSQEQMAALCCISTRQYQNLESGKKQPLFQTMVNISLKTGLDLNDCVQALCTAGYQVNDDKTANVPPTSGKSLSI